MSQKIPIYIPTYINNATYQPARVLPRLLFYNGNLQCEKYYIQRYFPGYGGISIQQFQFPYFDNYNVVSGQFPTTDSRSLLFNNEAAVYGELPTENLYTTYWEKYVDFLYNPITRVLNCKAIIPLADYFKMSLNDIVNFRGNYWHLRAINNYSLKSGDCDLQLLGPVISDVFNGDITTTTTTTTSTTTTTTTSTTTTSTTTTTTTTVDPANCADRQYQNNGSNTVYWSAKNCLGNNVGGYFAANGGNGFTGCIDITTFGASGTLTLLNTYYC